MQHLLNLLAAIALLVWATRIVRTGVLRLFGSSLRELIARSIGNRFRALLAGLAVTSLVQSSTATGLIVASFVGRGLIAKLQCQPQKRCIHGQVRAAAQPFAAASQIVGVQRLGLR